MAVVTMMIVRYVKARIVPPDSFDSEQQKVFCTSLFDNRNVCDLSSFKKGNTPRKNSFEES